MSSPVISVENVSKQYRLGEVGTGTLSHDLNRWWHKVRGKEDPYLRIGETNDRSKKGASDYSWALRDVSFQVKQGEVLGIIGRNGAGKSTLLKILSRVTTPTSGQIKVKGRIASLLEVGTGFHPELTGRENIYINGAILGMRKDEITRKLDEIIDFSGCERYIDTPVKRYSSGMYVRLAFAVAAHLEPEILIIDEVLAVGDMEFQKKCLGKIKDVAGEGRTVLFVSHNMPAVLQLTRKCVVLTSGQLTFEGMPELAVEHYSATSRNSDDLVTFDVRDAPREHEVTGLAKLIQLRFLKKLPIFRPDEDFCFMARVVAEDLVESMRFSMTIFSKDGSPVGSCFGPDNLQVPLGTEGEFIVTLPTPRLAPGKYYCGIAIGKGDHTSGHQDFDIVMDTLHFSVMPHEGASGTLSSWALSWGPINFPRLKQEAFSCSTSP